MIEHFTIGILTALLIGQQAYWSVVVFKLTNRLMSRDYQGFVQATFKPGQLHQVVSDEDSTDPIADKQAKELNAIIGF